MRLLQFPSSSIVHSINFLWLYINTSIVWCITTLSYQSKPLTFINSFLVSSLTSWPRPYTIRGHGPLILLICFHYAYLLFQSLPTEVGDVDLRYVSFLLRRWCCLILVSVLKSPDFHEQVGSKFNYWLSSVFNTKVTNSVGTWSWPQMLLFVVSLHIKIIFFL